VEGEEDEDDDEERLFRNKAAAVNPPNPAPKIKILFIPFEDKWKNE
jgi:hypothetical protein